MERKVLEARIREAKGKSAAKRLRAAGRLPAVIYDEKGESMPVDVSESEFAKLFRQITMTTTVDIKLDDGRERIAFVKDFQHDIVSDKVRHVDFYAVDPDKMIRTKIHVRITGAPDAVRLGGVFEAGLSEIEIECLPKDLPERVAVDVTSLGLDKTILVKDLALGDGVRVLTPADAAIASVKLARSSLADEAAGA